MKIECPRGLGKPEVKCKFHGRNLVVFLVFSPFMNSTFLHSCHIAIWEPQSIWKFHWLLYCGVDHQSSGDKTVLTSHLVVVFGFTAARWYTYQAIKAFFGPAFVAAQTKKKIYLYFSLRCPHCYSWWKQKGSSFLFAKEKVSACLEL